MKTTPIALLLAVVTSVLGSTDSDNGRFLLIGDWGRRPENSKLHANQRQVAEAMGKATANNKPAAVICLGDNFYPSGAPTVDSPLFEQAFEKVYTAPSLQVPFWVLLGNHDYYISAKANWTTLHNVRVLADGQSMHATGRVRLRSHQALKPNSCFLIPHLL